MKKYKIILACLFLGGITACNNAAENTAATSDNTTQAASAAGGQESVKDDESAKDVVKVAVSSKDHTTLVAALKAADLVTSLSNAGPFTVFAPTNQAFTALLSALSLTDINQIPIGTLLAVLRYHVVGGRAFSSDLANGSLTMLAGGSTTVNLSNGTGGGPTILGNSNGGSKSNITATNIVCRNGVVHLIDRVLIP